MEQRISLITLGVSDLGRARSFYEALGWAGAQQPDDEVCFFQAGGWCSGFGLPSEVMALGGVELAHNVRSPEEVGQVLEEADALEARLFDRRPSPSGAEHRRLRRPVWRSMGGRPQRGVDYHRRWLDPHLAPKHSVVRPVRTWRRRADEAALFGRELMSFGWTSLSGEESVAELDGGRQIPPGYPV